MLAVLNTAPMPPSPPPNCTWCVSSHFIKEPLSGAFYERMRGTPSNGYITTDLTSALCLSSFDWQIFPSVENTVIFLSFILNYLKCFFCLKYHCFCSTFNDGCVVAM